MCLAYASVLHLVPLADISLSADVQDAMNWHSERTPQQVINERNIVMNKIEHLAETFR